MNWSEPLSLLCLPCAGASATMYLRWRRQLPEWVRLVPIELPGRGARLAERHAGRFGELVATLCDEQAPAMRGRFALLGHSMGALLAHGMARHLQAQSQALPEALFVLGSPAPSRRKPGRFAHRHDEAALLADLRRQGGTPEEVLAHPELRRMTLTTLAADYQLCESFVHRPGAPLAMPLVAMGGRVDEIETEDLSAWVQEAGAAFTLDWFDGGHFFIRQQETQVLAAIVRALSSLPFTDHREVIHDTV